jgi:hypothetical protein
LNDVLLARRAEIEARLKALQLESSAARLWAQLAFMNATPATADAATPTTVGPYREELP